MKNTKILFIRLYIGTLYSNFIVPLRGSNYIQLLYGDIKERLGIFFKQTRQLVWQGHTNGFDQNLTETWLGFGQNLVKTWSAFESKNVPEVSLKCHHQITTETPPEITTERVQMSVNECSFQQREIGSIRVKSGQKVGISQCRLVQSSSSVRADSEAEIGADRGKSGQFLASVGTKMRVNECKWVQKIGTNRDRSGRNLSLKCYQMLPNATKNKASTYHYLILPNNLFMFCVGQKLL